MRAFATKPASADTAWQPASGLRRSTGLPTAQLQRGAVPAAVYEALRSPGQPLGPPEREFFERRFIHDFSRVRIHADDGPAASAQARSALAYTVGRDIVFAPGQYRPATDRGRRLVAHELAHVVQQHGALEAPERELTLEPADGADEREARDAAAATVYGDRHPVAARRTPASRRLMRADPDAVAQIGKLRTVVGAGIQFWPTNVVDTRIGPVTVGPGLLGQGASRLNVIVGENLTPRILARELLPLWTTATPFTPPGGGAPVPPGPLTEEQLARGLLVY